MHRFRLVVLVGLSWLALSATAEASPSGVVISQLRTRTAASAFDDYAQITNTTASTVDLSGWQLYDCFQSTGTQRVGADGDPLPPGTTLPAGQTFVFGKNGGDYTGVADALYTFQVSETGGWQLRDNTGTVQDGAGAPGTLCAEGTGLTFPTSGSDFTFKRTQDTGDNAADFTGPSGSANGTACGAPCTPAPAQMAIHDIQGAGATTPVSGRKVTITGIVVGIDNQAAVSNFVNVDPTQEGIYVEAPASAWDNDPNTSEGIFVGGLSDMGRQAAHLGSTVTVSGTVREIFNLTALDATGDAPTYSGTPHAANMPAPVSIDTARAEAQPVAANGTRDYYETLEAMRVTLPIGTANSGGTDKFGELFLQPGKTRKRVFRNPAQTAGPSDLLNLGQDAGSEDIDPTNPSQTPASTTRVNADLFARVAGATGPLGFAFSEYQIIPQQGMLPAIADPGPISYPPDAPTGEFRIANFNMENLFGVGMVDDGHTFTQDEIDAKTTRLANAIKQVLHSPQIVSVEEVASQASLQEVADKLGTYSAIWQPSNDARHIAVGFLVKHGVKITNVEQLGKSATTTATGCNDDSSANPQLFERPPLAISVKKGDTQFTLIANHWASQGHPEPCRQAQGDFLAGVVRSLEASGGSAIVTGDFNDFEDSPALTQNLIAGNTLVNQWKKAPADDRYSFQFDGQLQTLDHFFVTKKLRPAVDAVEYVHFDNDYYERDETTSPTKVSDHDPPVLQLDF